MQTAPVTIESFMLADWLAQLMVSQLQIALLQFGKKVTGETLTSIKWQTVVNGIERQERIVTAGGGYKFIVTGRKPGGKMPVHAAAGPTKRGGLRFEPLPAMLKWFVTLGIPRQAWFPIMRKIAIRGIKPTDVPGRALRNAQSKINAYVGMTSANIARGIIKVN